MTRTPARDTSGRFAPKPLRWWQKLALMVLRRVPK